jgi:hypothetical protein
MKCLILLRQQKNFPISSYQNWDIFLYTSPNDKKKIKKIYSSNHYNYNSALFDKLTVLTDNISYFSLWELCPAFDFVKKTTNS